MRIIFFLIFTGVLMASSLPKYETKTLSNGLQIVVIPMKNNSDVITTNIFYKVGSGDEIMGKSGIAHMLEHLNFKSTKNLKEGEFDEIVKGFGGVNNAGTSFDYTQYFIKSSSKNLSKSLELFAELMNNLSLKDSEFQPERNVVMEERLWRTDNSPIGYLYFRLYNNAFLYHPYHWTPIGFKNDIKNWTIEDIKNFHKIYYQPSNAVIVVAGDIDSNEVFDQSEKYFNKIKTQHPIPIKYQVEPKQDGAKRVYLTKDSEVDMVAIAYKIPAYNHEDQTTLSAISTLLSSGKSSRLYNRLINEKKLANQIYAYNMETKDPNLFIFIAVCNPDINAEDVEKEILVTIKELQEGNISDDEITKLKTNTKADFIYSLESSSALSTLFGSYFVRGDITPLLNYEKDINKLDKKTITNVAKKYFIKDTSTTVILKKEHK